jgi:DNA-binding response OmpR family regulator
LPGTDEDLRLRPTRPVVLVCEDDASLRELMRLALGRDFDVVDATDGEESLELARNLRPDVILVDLMLPKVLGLDVIRSLRGNGWHAPVVALSAWTHLDREALAAGADRFLAKPFEPDELRATIAELLEQAA